MKLAEFLTRKGEEYAPFDPHRVHRIFKAFSQDFLRDFKPKVIHLVGTNGKGSTGRWIASGLRNYKVLHFTSPHLFAFNERFYCNGDYVSDKELEAIHSQMMIKPYMQEASYFEYATFLALMLAKDLDFLVFEAGLGGEFDSTNIIADKISVFTQIGLDHTEILGENIAQIAKTKLNAMGKIAFLGIQKYPQVIQIAQEIAKQKHSQLILLNTYDQISFLPTFLQQNLSLAKQVLSFLKDQYKRVICEDLSLDLIGRMQHIRQNIWLDVGHNPDCAEALAQEIKEKLVLVYNTYEQKDIFQTLNYLKNQILRVEIIEVADKRIVSRAKLEDILNQLKLPFKDFQGFQDEETYLVFGSFSVVREALRWLNER